MKEIGFIVIIWLMALGAVEYVGIHIVLLVMSAMLVALTFHGGKSTKGDGFGDGF